MKNVEGIDCKKCLFWAKFNKEVNQGDTGICFLEVNDDYGQDNDHIEFWVFADKFYRDSIIPNCKMGLTGTPKNPLRLKLGKVNGKRSNV